MKALISLTAAVLFTAGTTFAAEQTWNGQISDSLCGAKHESESIGEGNGKISDQEVTALLTEAGYTAADFEKVGLWAEREKRPVYLGEFGVYERAPSDSRLRYLSFMARSADRRGWAWAYWQFDHDFAAFDSARQAWKPDILRALMPPAR